MSDPAKDAAALAQLRAEIDRIDAAMHELLIERSQVIQQLMQVKGTQQSGSAFRPAREALIMRKLVEQHRGILPLDTVESIWRVIIATFTHLQAPFPVHADMSAGEGSMRDSARFHFGFTVPLIPHIGAAGAIAAVAASKGDLALVPTAAVSGAGPWWHALEGELKPKIIARLPFVERSDHPASLPVFAISHPAREAEAAEVEVHSLHVSGWSAAAASTLSPIAEVIAEPGSSGGNASLLISVPRGVSMSAVTEALTGAGAAVQSAALVGSHASRYTLGKSAAVAAR